MKPEEIELTEEEIKTGEARLKEIVLGTINEEKAAADPAEASYKKSTEAAYNVLAKDILLIKLLAEGKEAEAMERLQHITARLSLNTIFAKVKEKDGTEQPITGAVLLDLIHKGIEQEELEAAGKLKYLLKAMLKYADKQPDIKSNPIAAKTLEAMHTLLDYLQQGAEPGEIAKFLEGKKEFIALPRPVGIENLFKIYDSKNHVETVRIDSGDMIIRYKGAFGWDEQTLLQIMAAAISNTNPYRATENLKTWIELPFTATMEKLGRKVTEENKRKFATDLRKKIFVNLASCSIELQAKKGGDSKRRVLGTGQWDITPSEDIIKFEMGSDFAGWLSSARKLGQYSNITLTIGSKNNPLPRVLANKMQFWYFDDDNRARGTYNILSVKTLLKQAEYILPQYETLCNTNNERHWKDRIKKKIEAALNEIQEKGLFEWEYCKQGLAKATVPEQLTDDYIQWSSLYITFKLIPKEPDQAERLENKQKRLEAAQSKQAVKEAETIIKADKIKKRQEKAKKGDSNPQKG